MHAHHEEKINTDGLRDYIYTSNGGSMCSPGCTYGRPKYYTLADITLLRFDVRAFAHTYTCCARYGYIPRKSRLNATAIAMSGYSVVRHVYHGASSRRDRELKYSNQPIAENQATMTPKAWISIPVTLLFADI